jgi:hypothetical protein
MMSAPMNIDQGDSSCGSAAVAATGACARAGVAASSAEITATAMRAREISADLKPCTAVAMAR